MKHAPARLNWQLGTRLPEVIAAVSLGDILGEFTGRYKFVRYYPVKVGHVRRRRPDAVDVVSDALFCGFPPKGTYKKGTIHVA